MMNFMQALIFCAQQFLTVLRSYPSPASCRMNSNPKNASAGSGSPCRHPVSSPDAPHSSSAPRTRQHRYLKSTDNGSPHRAQAVTTPEIFSDGVCHVRKKWYRTREPAPFGSTSARCHGISGLGAITVYRVPDVCNIPPRLPPIKSVACHPSRMHSATALGE